MSYKRIPVTTASGGAAAWYTGAGAPSNSLGSDGDFYLRSSNGAYYSKVSGAWVVQGNLTGNTGATGPSGPPFIATGSYGSPDLITAVGGITPSGDQRELHFVRGNGGPIDITANPQIAPGILVAQELVLIGTDDTDTVKLDNGTGLALNGPITLKGHSILNLVWDGFFWMEFSRA